MYICVFRAWCIVCSFHLNQHLLITHNLPVSLVGPGEKVVKTVIGQSHSGPCLPGNRQGRLPGGSATCEIWSLCAGVCLVKGGREAVSDQREGMRRVSGPRNGGVLCDGKRKWWGWEGRALSWGRRWCFMQKQEQVKGFNLGSDGIYLAF